MDFYIFGLKTLARSYLLKAAPDGVMKIVESPQHMYMRVACALWSDSLENIFKTEPMQHQLLLENIHNLPQFFISYPDIKLKLQQSGSLIDTKEAYLGFSQGYISMATPTMVT